MIATREEIRQIFLKKDGECEIVPSIPIYLGETIYKIYTAKGGEFIADGTVELKECMSDIVYLQFTGKEFATGDYILVSDRHGILYIWEE